MKQVNLPSYDSSKHGIRTNLFSDRLPDHYLYLTTNFGLTADDTLVFLGLYLHDYIV